MWEPPPLLPSGSRTQPRSQDFSRFKFEEKKGKNPGNEVVQAKVVQKMDSTIHRVNLYPVDNVIGFPNTLFFYI